MLLIRVRVSPWRERDSRSSSGRVTVIVPSSRDAEIGAGTVNACSPFGPFTRTSWPSTVTSSPEGTEMGCLPMRDICVSSFPLPDVREDFAAHALLGCLLVREESRRRREDRDAESAEHPREAVRLGVHAQTRLRHTADAGDRTLTVGSELQIELEVLPH